MPKVAHFEAEMFKHRLPKELDEIIDPIKKFDQPKFTRGPLDGGSSS